MSSQRRGSRNLKDGDKTRDELTRELVELHESVAELQAGESSRTQVEESPQATEQMLQTILSAAPLGISFVVAGKLRWTNRAMARMFGYERQEDYLGKDISEFYSTNEQYKRVQEELYRSLREGNTAETEAQLRRKDGTIFYGHMRISALDPSDPGKGTITTITDISERKRVEEALRVETERFQMLVEGAPVGMVMISKDGTFKYVNPKFTEIFGYDLGDVPDGRQWFQKAYPDPAYRHEVISVWKEDFAGLSTGGTISRVFTVTCKDGSQKIINFRPVKLVGEDLMTCEDVTQREGSQNALRQSEERYRTILESLYDGYYEVDLNGNFTFVNEQVAELFGAQDAKQMIGNNFSRYMSTEGGNQLFKTFHKVWVTGKPIKAVDGKFTRNDGAELVADFSVALIRNADGKRLGFRGICRDVTERQRALEALRRSEETARALLNATTDAALLIDTEGTVLALNEVTASRLGLAVPELLGRNLFELFPPELAKERRKWCDKVVESGTPVRFVDEHAGLHLDHSIHPLFDRDGRVERLAVFSRDITEQKRALDALGQSEEKYRTIIENIEDGYYEVDVKGNFTIVNPSTARMFGRSEDQLVGRHFGQFTTPDEAERLFKAYRKVWTVGEPLSFDALFLAADGTERRLELSGSLVKDSEGHRQGFRGVARDITQRLRAEQALRQSEETARALLNATTDAAFLIDTNGKVLALNEVAADRLGLTVQELVGHNLFKLFPTDLASERRNWCDKVVESGKPVRFVDTEAGLYLDNSVHPLFDRDGKVERLAIFSRDITEQKRAVDALQESEEKYRTIIENIEDGYYEVDVKGNFTLLNPSTARLFGRSEEEIAGQNFGQFTIPDEAGRIFNAYHKVWTTGEPARFDALFLAADGSERRLELSVSLIRDSGGHRRGFRGVARDITERLRAEQALRQSEETARALLNATTDAALLIDTEGTVLALNEVAANRSGLTLQELVGRNLFELFPPDLAKQRRMWCDKVVESGTPVRFVDEDAGLHLDHSVHPLFDRYGRVERLAIFSRDITDQKRAVDALRQSEEKYRTLVKDIEEAFYEVDVKGNFTLINQSGARLLGRSEEEMVGQNFGQFTTPDEAPRVFKQFHKVWTTGETARFDALFLSADGSERRFELSVSLVRDEGGHRRGFRGLARDITQRLQDEQALRQSEETARALLDATTDEALLMDSSGVLLALNQEMALRLGLEPQELVGRNLFEFFPRHLARERKVWCDQVITSGSPVRFVDEDAGAYLDHSIHPVFGNSGNVERLAIFSRDITDQVQAEETLRKAKEAAEAADRAKSDFLANMSHELRTPLNAIIALSEVLEDQTFGKLNDTQLEYVGVVLNSGRHLLQLINDILDLAKVESGKLELHLSEVSLRPVLEGSLVMVKEKALKHGLKLELRIGEEITDTVIQADDVKLKQILFNLLSNAAKFTPDGGEIVLDARLGRDELIFSVSDTGIGIRSEDQERIFGEFEQIDSSYARQQQGTGLGLALTRRLVELHGGRIWVESEGEGKGSTFTFTIPIFGPQERKIAAAEESVIPQSIQPESPSLSQLFLDESRPTILVVDDDPTANDVIAHYLSEAGYSVAQAFNADQAIEMARRLVPLAITLDVLMPRISGFDVLIELKSQPDTKDIPVVMVTVVDDRELALSLGAVDFFVKPLDRKRFLGVMRAIESKKANECLKVVVVDDEPYVVETISEILQSRGYEVLRAYSGRQGIDLAVAHLPDVIVLDLLMPQMTGFEVVEQLREHPALRETPIIVYTAKDLTEEDRQRLRAPVRAIASKSDDKKQLLRQLERLLRSDHADDESKGM